MDGQTHPSLYLRWNRIRVFKSTIRLLGTPKFVQFSVHQDGTSMILSPFDKKSFTSFRIFMYENEDKTATKFFIVTCVNSIHIYEVKVEDDPEGEAEYKLKPFILFVAGSWEKTKVFVKKACDRIKVFTIKAFRKIKEVTVKLFNKIKAFVKKLFTKSNKQDSQDFQELPEIQEPEEPQEPQEIQELKYPTQKKQEP